MKTKILTSAFSVISLILLPLTVQALPKVETNIGGELDHTKNELQLTLQSFKKQIVMGKITKDGSIHIDLPTLDIKSAYEKVLMGTPSLISIFEGECKNKDVLTNNASSDVFFYKFSPMLINLYGIQVAGLTPVSSKGVLDNNQYSNKVLKTGSKYYFLNIEKETKFKGKCRQNSMSGLYDIELLRTADIHFNKGWNLIKETLVDTQQYSKGDYHRQIPKTISYTKANINDSDIKWFLSRFEKDADEQLKVAKKLYNLTPLTEKQFMQWMPNKLGDLPLTSKKYSDTVPRSNNKNNLHLIYSNEEQKREVEIYVLDSAKSVDDLLMVNMVYDMEASFGKDNQQKTYVAQYDKKESTTKLLYKIKDRVLINATGLNMKPEELWSYIKKLNAENLINQ